jgi:aryl-alcohol dehydrogenase
MISPPKEDTLQVTAAVLRRRDAPFSIEVVELSTPGPADILVRIVGTGLCHTDVLPRSPEFPAPTPMILGHEGAGVVEAVGDDVRDLEVGDHVVLSYDSCRACDNCSNGRNPYCREFFPRNMSGLALDGRATVHDAYGQPIGTHWFGQSSFASHVLVDARNAIPVDRDLPLALLGPLGCGVQTGAGSALMSLGIGEGDSFIVLGAGAVGLSAVMAARCAGAATIVAVDLKANRRQLAVELGATDVLDGARPDLLTALSDITRGGADYALDTTGVPTVITTAIGAVRPAGTCGLVGFQRGDLILDPIALGTGRNLKGILEGDAVPRTFIPRLLDLWRQGQFPFDRLITTYPLEAINDAECHAHDGSVVKPVLLPGGQAEDL